MRIWRSDKSYFDKSVRPLDGGTDETLKADSAYTHRELQGIAEAGFDAIWVHGLLRNMVPSSIFPEFGIRAEQHQRTMNRLVERASTYGLRVFVYLQPPRAIATCDDFWEHHRDVEGSHETRRDPRGQVVAMTSLCTSTEKVRLFLRESSEALLRAVPGLGGLILITASEFPSHCWARSGKVLDETGNPSNFTKPDCPRCAERSPSDVVTEIIRLIRNGAKAGGTSAEVIAWNWSWNAYEPDPSPKIIGGLPHDVILMADFERGGRKTILGKERDIDEYSLSYVGPSRRFKEAKKCAVENGLRVIAKLQIGTTHELATVPNLPLIGNLVAKAEYCHNAHLEGFVGCWNFGNRLSVNSAAFNFALSGNSPGTGRKTMEAFAEGYFHGCRPIEVADAWEQFGSTMDHYPFSTPFLYSGPINHTLAYPFLPRAANTVPCGNSHRAEEQRGDSLELSLGPYTLDQIIQALDILQSGWCVGLDVYRSGLGRSDTDHAREELNTAIVCYHIFRSVRNTYQCWRLRRNWTDAMLPEYETIATDELANLQSVLPVLRKDTRQGFHGEAFTYLFNEELVENKINELKKQLNHTQTSR